MYGCSNALRLHTHHRILSYYPIRIRIRALYFAVDKDVLATIVAVVVLGIHHLRIHFLRRCTSNSGSKNWGTKNGRMTLTLTLGSLTLRLIVVVLGQVAPGRPRGIRSHTPTICTRRTNRWDLSYKCYRMLCFHCCCPCLTFSRNSLLCRSLVFLRGDSTAGVRRRWCCNLWYNLRNSNHRGAGGSSRTSSRGTRVDLRLGTWPRPRTPWITSCSRSLRLGGRFNDRIPEYVANRIFFLSRALTSLMFLMILIIQIPSPIRRPGAYLLIISTGSNWTGRHVGRDHLSEALSWATWKIVYVVRVEVEFVCVVGGGRRHVDRSWENGVQVCRGDRSRSGTVSLRFSIKTLFSINSGAVGDSVFINTIVFSVICHVSVALDMFSTSSSQTLDSG